jgi:ribosome-associated toxin RatA of RatAB toxin-antitoxin module
MRSSIAIDVAAPPEVLFAIAHDITRWEALLPHYLRSRVERSEPDGSLVCRFIARRELVPVLGFGIPVAWRSRTWHDEGTRMLRFRHLGGATGGMDVTWRIEPTPIGCRVEIEHELCRPLPLLGETLVPALIDRLFVRPIATRTLASFRAIAEAIGATSQSEAVAATNPRA